MNFTKIYQTCPKAFEKYYKFSVKKAERKRFDINEFLGHKIYSSTHNENRDLYDFFDKGKIIICINPYYSVKYPLLFYYAIYGEKEERIDNNDVDKTYKSRKQAETAAFPKAFKILEEKINDK